MSRAAAMTDASEALIGGAPPLAAPAVAARAIPRQPLPSPSSVALRNQCEIQAGSRGVRACRAVREPRCYRSAETVSHHDRHMADTQIGRGSSDEPRLFPGRIQGIERIIAHIYVKIDLVLVPDWVSLEETRLRRRGAQSERDHAQNHGTAREGSHYLMLHEWRFKYSSP